MLIVFENGDIHASNLQVHMVAETVPVQLPVTRQTPAGSPASAATFDLIALALAFAAGLWLLRTVFSFLRDSMRGKEQGGKWVRDRSLGGKMVSQQFIVSIHPCSHRSGQCLLGGKSQSIMHLISNPCLAKEGPHGVVQISFEPFRHQQRGSCMLTEIDAALGTPSLTCLMLAVISIVSVKTFVQAPCTSPTY